MNIIITGAGRGIGFETAKGIAAAGDHTIIAIARNSLQFKALKNACLHENIKAKIIPIEFDLNTIGDIEGELIRKIASSVDSIDVLINNAGLLINKPFKDTDTNDLFAQLTTNFIAPTLLIKGLLPYFAKNASIVNIVSMGSFQGSVKFAGLSGYSASKGALSIITECLAEELTDKSLHINALALGSVNTQMLSEAFPGYTAKTSASDMGRFIANFALEGSRLFNGKIIPVSIANP